MHALAASLPRVPSDLQMSHPPPDPDLLESRQFDWREWYRRPENKLVMISVGFVALATKLFPIDIYKATEECKEVPDAEGNKKVAKFKCATDIVGIILSAAGFVVAGPLVWMQAKEWANKYRLAQAQPQPRSIRFDEHLEDFSLQIRNTSLPHLSEVFALETWANHSTSYDPSTAPPWAAVTFTFSSTTPTPPPMTHSRTATAPQNIALRVSFGTPPPPRKIDSRSDLTSVPYFEDGVGADIGIQVVWNHRRELEGLKKEIAESLSAQIDCYLSETFPFDKGHSDAMYLQLYDDKARNTWMAANIALYGPNGNSGFTEMGGVRGSLETHEHCTGMKHSEL
ncbi:hypothetical protein V8F06_007828 [Rhypophila decipiens]